MSKANYDLPDDKIKKIIRESGAKTKREAIIIALEDYIRRKKLEKLFKSYGMIPTCWTPKSLRKYRA